MDKTAHSDENKAWSADGPRDRSNPSVSGVNAPSHGAAPTERAPFEGLRSAAFGGQELDLQQLLRTLWRRKMVIVSTVVLLTTLVTLVVLQLTPRYTATANVMLETRQNKVVDIESVMSGMSADMTTVLGEVEVISSTSLIRRVVSKLNLTQDPEFNTKLKKTPWYAAMFNLETYLSRDVLVSMGLRKAEIELSEGEAQEKLDAEVVEAVKANLSVAPVYRSLVIAVSFTSTNPRKAALIANTIADNYIVDQLEAKYEATQRATSWLNERIGDLRDKVQHAEAAVEAYREDVEAQVGQGTQMTNQQISELNSQVILAQTKQAEARARLEQVERLLKTESGLASAAEVLNSQLILRLRDQEATLLRKVSEMESRYGARHPSMIKATAELADLRASIEREVKKIAQSLRNEVEVEQVRASTLQNNLARLETKSGAQGRAEIRLRELEREANANRLLYENFLSRFKETSQQDNLQQADARVISKADVPLLASFPKKKLTVMLGFVGSLFMGVVLVFVLERLDNSFRSAEQVEQMTGIPAIGMVPLVTGNILGRAKVGRHLLDNPTSSITESVRTLRTSLLLSDVDNPPKVVGVTSTVPSEGKSTLAMWLAQVAATSGQKVILIDCDLRRPSVHKTLELDNTNSLVEVLSEACTLQEGIIRDVAGGMYVLPGKVTQANALDLLSSKHMAKSVQALKQHFDLIVLDSPPVLAVSDAKVIGQLVDKMLYVVKWDSTPRGLVLAGLKAAKSANIDLAGIVLSQVNVKKHAQYGYGDHGYYYGKYKDYYSS